MTRSSAGWDARCSAWSLAPWLCPALHPRTGARDFCSLGGNDYLKVYSEERHWTLSRKFTLWSYATPLCHSFAQAIHGNARVWMKSFFSCFRSRQYNPSSVRFPAVSVRNQQSRALRPTLFPKEAGFHVPVMGSCRRLLHAASGGWLFWSDKCFSFWVMVA